MEISCQSKHKFFLSLLLRDRINSIDQLHRKIMHPDDYTCALYNTGHDKLLHLFLEYRFNNRCWRFLNITRGTQLSPNDMLLEARQQFGSEIFRKVLITASWCISCHWNNIFHEGAISLNRW